MSPRIHGMLGFLALFTICVFFVSTLTVEIGGDYQAIAAVKRGILWGLLLLIPAMMAAGGSGAALAKTRGGRLLGVKRKRMAIAAANGLLILTPMAFLLDRLASAGDFGPLFYGAQALELGAGAVNIILLSLNGRDGLRMARRVREVPGGAR